jgi:hypothetical protein
MFASVIDHDQALEDSIEGKFVILREGSGLRTVEEINQQLIDDAGTLIGYQADEFDPEFIGEAADEAAQALRDHGYFIVENDGYIIYYGLTDDESDYLGGY